MSEQRLARQGLTILPGIALMIVALLLALILAPFAAADDVVDETTVMQDLQEVVEADEFMTLLAKKHPAIRQGFMQLANEAVRDGKTQSEYLHALTVYQSQVYGKYFATYLPGASELDIDEVNEVFVDILGYLQQREDNTCYVWITGHKIGNWVPLQRAIPIEELQRQNDVLERVLAGAIRAPMPPSDPALAEQGLVSLFTYLSRVHPPGFLNEMELTLNGKPNPYDSQRTCELLYQLFVGLGRIDSAERAAVWKTMFASSISQ